MEGHQEGAREGIQDDVTCHERFSSTSNSFVVKADRFGRKLKIMRVSRMVEDPDLLTKRQMRWLRVVGRLKPGDTREQAQA